MLSADSDYYSESMRRTNRCVRRNLLAAWTFLVFCLTVYVGFNTYAREEHSHEGHFWVLTDSHIDILYQDQGDPITRCRNVSTNTTGRTRRKFGHPDCDAPMDLLMSAFGAAKKIDSEADFIVWLGDGTSHLAWKRDTILPVNTIFSEQLRKHFPNTLIIPVLGNHDIVLNANRSSRFEQFYTGTKYSSLITDDGARETFIKGGYYSVRHRSVKGGTPAYVRFVVLNTVMFQSEYSMHFDPEEAERQIEWFNRTMAEAFHLNDRVLLLAHVPFGINENLLYKFYEIRYEQRLLSIVDLYASNIIMCLSGHRHQDTFRVYSTINATMGILGHSAISPISSLNQPSIRHYSYNRRSLVLTDYEQYVLDLHEAELTQRDLWKLSYRFSSWYHQSKELTSQTLHRLVYLVRTDPFYTRRFLLAKHHTETLTLARHKIVQTLCALTLFHFDEFLFCTRVLEQQSVHYEPLIINHSDARDLLLDEQSAEYRAIYTRVFLGLLGFTLVFLWITHQIYSTCCSRIRNENA